MFTRLSLTSKMVLAIVLVGLAVTSISFWFLLGILRGTTLESELVRAGTIRALIKAEIDDEIEHLVGLTRVLSQNASLHAAMTPTPLRSSDERIGLVLDPAFKVLGLNVLNVMGTSGQVLYSANKKESFSGTDKIWGIAEALSGTEALASWLSPAGIQVYAMAPLREGANTFGALVLGFKLDEKFLQRVAADTKSRITVVDAKLQVLASYSAQNAPVVVDANEVAASLLLKNKIHPATDSNLLTTVYFADQVLDQTLIWIVSIDSREAYAASLTQQKHALVFTVLMAALAALVLGWLAHGHARQIARVEHKAEQVANQILGGPPAQRSKSSRNLSEIESLAYSVDVMAHRLTQHVQELGDAHAALTTANVELEQKVQTRMAKILEGEIRFHMLVEQSGYSTLLCAADKSVRFANQAALELLSCPDPEMIVGCELGSMFMAQDRQLVVGTLDALWASPGRREIEAARVMAIGGAVVTVKVAAVSYLEDGHIQVLVVLDDITQQIADRALLKEQLQFIDQLLDAIPLPLSFRDARGQYLRINQAYETMYLCSRQNVQHKTVFDVLPYELALQVAQHDRAATQGSATLAYENCVTLSGEPQKFLQSQIVSIRRSDQSLIGVIAVDTDVTLIRRNENELRQANIDLGNLSHKLLRTQEEERRRIARDLHDQVGQILTALKMSLQLISRRVSILPESLLAPIALTEEVLGHARSLTASLHPHILEDLGLVAAVDWLVERYVQPVGLKTALRSAVAPDRSDPAVELVAFRVIQESLTNVIRHAHASGITIVLDVVHDRLHILVQDDGDGFDAVAPDQTTKRLASLGLASMRERVAEVGGQLAIDSVVGVGTEVRVTLPWGPAEPIHKEPV